jgi:predicted TIM-barrel fold metal-dependent hydrolase
MRRNGTFFGIDHVLFATDWPFGPPTEEANIASTLGVLKQGLDLAPADLGKVLGGNPRRLLGLPACLRTAAPARLSVATVPTGC